MWPMAARRAGGPLHAALCSVPLPRRVRLAGGALTRQWCPIMFYLSLQKKTAESINSKLQLVMKSGKAVLGYKQVVKSLRNGDGRAPRFRARAPAATALPCHGWVFCFLLLVGRAGIAAAVCRRCRCSAHCAVARSVSCLTRCSSPVPCSEADPDRVQLPAPAQVRA